MITLPTFSPPGWEWRWDESSMEWRLGWIKHDHVRGTDEFRPVWCVTLDALIYTMPNISYLLVLEPCRKAHQMEGLVPL